ncbi:hypothetical protein NP534_02740 [Pseudomonas sp. 39004]|uniref:hypothetical protein n=1 Tax=Pseudomonas sp. 39004 TaxID=2967213 RepID=UPI0023632F38|nr:hypothetical protein [Pseudomonas sp. 39004]MDD1959012.1 hypothetical protein [Pseudomonas sp. 39004]
MRRSLFWFGVVLTFVYAAFMYWAVGEKISALKAMELNAVGDFMAGVFSPLAFLWLVLGFVQQGFELRISSDALILQAKELKASVVQQTELAVATKQSLKYQGLLLEPVFHLKFGGISEDFDESGRRETCSFTLSNVGATCEQIVVYVIGGSSMPSAMFNFAVIEKNSASSFNVVDIISEEDKWEFRVSYMKSDGQYGYQYFDVVPVASSGDGDWYVSIQKMIK